MTLTHESHENAQQSALQASNDGGQQRAKQVAYSRSSQGQSVDYAA